MCSSPAAVWAAIASLLIPGLSLPPPPTCTPLIQSARRVNDGKSRWVIEQVQARAAALEDQLGRPARIGCLGLAFKPDVDDLARIPRPAHHHRTAGGWP